MTGHPQMKGDEVQHRGLTCRALFHNIRTYAVVISVTWFLYGLGWGTFVTSISTIEKRFNLQSTQAGMIIGSYEIGHLSFALLISHFGNRFNTPKLVGFSVILLAAFHGLMTLPKFIIDPAPLSLSEGANGTVSESSLLLCRNNSQFSSSLQNSDPCSNIGAEAAATSSEIAFAIFLASFVALGIVGTPMNTLAVSYLDDNADSPAQSVLFFGILGCMLSLGPMVGGFMNSEMLSLPEDLQETTLTPDHPAWVGAWWLQKMIEMGLFLIPACLFFFFPRKMVKPGTDDTGTNQTDGRQITNAKQNPAVGRESNKFAPKDYLHNGRKEEETAGENSPMMEKKNMAEVGAESEEVKYTWKSLVTTLHRLVCNPTYIFITLSACCIIYLLGGLFSFLPKYYEKQFGISASRASTIIGVVTGVFGCGGNILGGLISSKFKLSFRSMVVFCVTCLAVAAVATFSAIFIGCESEKLVPSSSTFYQNSSWSCSAPCDCSPDDLDPVCDTSSGVTFLSPCYAGCLAANQTTIGDSAIQDYYQCSCSRSGHVVFGFCPRDCSGPLVLFSVAMVIVVLFSSMVNAPSVILLLRSVDKADKTLAVGLGTCFISLLGWMPSSTLYGIVIDGTCDVWKSTCGTKGACWHYHGDKFRVRLHGVTFAFVAAAFLFYVGVLYFSKGKFIADDETNERGKMELCCTSKKHDMR